MTGTMVTSPPLAVRIEPIEQLAPHRERWQMLAAQALEANPFYSPEFLLGAARHFERPGALKALSLWRGEAMVGLLPLHRPNWREGMPFGVTSAYWNPYICLTVPLVAAEEARATLEAMLETLDSCPFGTSALNFPMLPTHRPFGLLLAHVMESQRRPHVIVSHYPRATLSPPAGMTAAEYIGQESAEQRKSFRRRQARLEQIGTVEYRVFATPGEERAAALEEFLHLEAAGWKGRHRTALKARPHTLAFMQEAFAQEGGLPYEIERLTVDGLPVAMCINLLGGGSAHTFKQAYDETLRPHAPGKLLDRRAITRVIEAGDVRRYDSCALPGYPIEDIWHERDSVAHLLVGLGHPPDSARTERLAHRAMRIQKLIRGAKGIVRALRPKPGIRTPSI